MAWTCEISGAQHMVSKKKLKDFLDSLEPKLGARDQQALLEHILDKMHKYYLNTVAIF